MFSKVAVIVITHNGKKYLKQCFESLLNQSYKDFEIFLLDNASTDGSSDFVRQNFPKVKIIRFNRNLGFSKGYNRAIGMVDADYIALLNDDTKVHFRWLEELVKAINIDKRVAAVGSKILFYQNPAVVQHAGGKITPIGAGMDIGFGEPIDGKYNIKRYVGYVCGAAMLIDKKIFEEVGGFDEDYFAYFEDVDLCWRFWLHGYKVLYVPTSIVYHKFGGSWGGRLTVPRLFFSHLNKLRNTIKNFELKNVFIGIVLNVLFDFIRILFLLKRRKFIEIMFIIKAWMVFLKDLKYLHLKRVKIKKGRRIPDDLLLKSGLICSLSEGLQTFLKLDS